jgi:hypothetical protein
VQNLTCSLKPVTPRLAVLTAACDIVRKFVNVKVRLVFLCFSSADFSNSSQFEYTLSHKPNASLPTWRQLLRIPQIYLCKIMSSNTWTSITNKFFHYSEEIFETFPSECPSKVPAHFGNSRFNYTEEHEKKIIVDFKSSFKMSLPKGFLKSVMTLSTVGDPKVARIDWAIEIKK